MNPSWKRTNFVYQENMLRFIHGENETFLLKPLGSNEEALELIMQELLRYDPIISGLDFLSDPVSVDSLIKWVKKYLDQGNSVGCYLHPEGTLVGVDVLYVRSIRDEPEFTQDSGKAFNRFIKFMKIIERYIKYNTRSQNSCNYLTSFGVFTAALYRNTKIRGGMITYRTKMAHHLRIKVIGAPFIGEKMQEIAKENSYSTLKTFYKQDMIDLGLDFSRGDIFPIKLKERFTYQLEKKPIHTPQKKKKVVSAVEGSNQPIVID